MTARKDGVGLDFVIFGLYKQIIIGERLSLQPQDKS